MTRSCLSWLVLAVVTTLAACGPKPTAGQPVTGARATDAALKLQDRWLVTAFKPKVALDPVLGGLLTAQLGNMLVTFEAQEVHAVGPGLDIRRNYEVVQSLFEHVDLIVFGDDGSQYELSGDFHADGALLFASKTSPWDGSGRLQRVTGE